MDLYQQFDQFLTVAEQMFGPRNPLFVVERVYYVDGGTPNRLMHIGPGRVEIQLSNAAKGDSDKTLMQLSHETVHTLWPIGVADTLVIEEGAATYFSMVAPTYIDSAYPHRVREGLVGDYAPYLAAENDVKALLSCNSAAIREARRGRSFCEITAEDLLTVAPGCAPDVVQRLVAKF
jgi:hypothetical protein